MQKQPKPIPKPSLEIVEDMKDQKKGDTGIEEVIATVDGRDGEIIVTAKEKVKGFEPKPVRELRGE